MSEDPYHTALVENSTILFGTFPKMWKQKLKSGKQISKSRNKNEMKIKNGNNKLKSKIQKLRTKYRNIKIWKSKMKTKCENKNWKWKTKCENKIVKWKLN